MKYVFHASFAEVKQSFLLAFWEFPVEYMYAQRRTFTNGGNLINVVYLSFMLLAKSALMTQAVCSTETIIFLYLLQPWGFSLRERMSGIERQTFLVSLLRPFSIPLDRSVPFLNLLPVMEDYFFLQQNPFITLIPEDKMNAQQALL